MKFINEINEIKKKEYRQWRNELLKKKYIVFRDNEIQKRQHEDLQHKGNIKKVNQRKAKILKKKKIINKHPNSFCHSFACNSISANKSKDAQNIMYSEITNYSPSSNTRNHNKRKKDKIKRTSNLKFIPAFKFNTTLNNNDNTLPIYYITNTSDEMFQFIKNDSKKPIISKFVTETLNILNEPMGCQMWLDELSPIFILIPREISIMKTTKVKPELNSISEILQRYGNNFAGGVRKSICQKYGTFGQHVQQGRHGVRLKNISDDQSANYTKLKKFLSRIEHITKQYIPSPILRGLAKAREKLRWSGMGSEKKEERSDGIWASLATSYNYISAVHTDKDFFLCAISPSCSHDDCLNASGKYINDIPTAIHFCLPDFGYAIAMKPGDILLFNPLQKHSVSMREEFYEDKTVFVTSFYLKSGVVSGNDNTPPEIEKFQLNMDNFNN